MVTLAIMAIMVMRYVMIVRNIIMAMVVLLVGWSGQANK